MAGVYLGLGSNLGNRQANLALALRMLEPLVRVEAVSALYESPPQLPAPPPAYLNAACRVVTGLTPWTLLRHVERIEGLIGRHEDGHWAPRPIDIDILLYNDEVIESETLTVPHARLIERHFVLRPLLDIDPGLVHSVTGERLEAALARVGEAGLVKIAEAGWEQREYIPA
jgi:2-amino-4-hydroxy-6-hydroxymethyldihydropteridine diphosphokinase